MANPDSPLRAVPWFGLLAPAGTPRMFWINCTRDVSAGDAEVRKKFDELGLEPVAHASRVCGDHKRRRPSGPR